MADPLPLAADTPAQPDLPPRRWRLGSVGGVIRRMARIPSAGFVEGELLGLHQVVRPGAVCFDVGASYGLYTYTLAELTGPRGAVHSFEPLPGPARVLTAGVRLMGLRNVHQHALALGRRAGTGIVRLPQRYGLAVHGRAFLATGASGLGSNAEFASERTVATGISTIDEVCVHRRIERVDFVKADVEGAELAVLQGGQRTLSRHRPTLLLEIEERHLARYGVRPSDVTGWLADLGYRMHHWVAGAWHRADAVTAASRNYLFTQIPLTAGGQQP